MYSKFGEFNSAEEINELAVNLRKEKDVESLRELAEENGIDIDIVEAFLDGDILFLCDDMTAAIGKIDVEAKELNAAEIMEDWVEYLKCKCFEDEGMAKAVRKKRKSLKGAMGALITWSFKHQVLIEQDIMKAAGVSAGRVTLGIPGMRRAKQIMSDYYMGR